MDKSWMEVEMDESMNLLRKKLDELNDKEPDELDHEEICSIEKIYKTIYYIMSIKKSLG